MKPKHQKHLKREKKEYQKPEIRKVKLSTDPTCNIAIISTVGGGSCSSMV